MAWFVELAAGTVTAAFSAPDGTPVAPGQVDASAANPQPQIGWTTPDGGQTWAPPAANSVLGNQQALYAKAAQAFTNNQTYLAIATPSQVQVVAQVAALTRQVNALIRLITEQLSDQTGT